MTIYRGFFAALLLASLFLLIGCAQPFRSAKSFNKAGKDYVRSLRWMEYQSAASLMDEPARSDFLENLESLGKIQIVDARLEEIDYRSGSDEGHTTVLVEYYRLPSASVQEARLRQKWIFKGVDLASGGEWRIETPFPPFP